MNTSALPSIHTNGELEHRPWYVSTRFHRIAGAILLAAVLVEGWIAVAHRENDFAVHMHYGRMFFSGESHRGPAPPYPLGRFIFNGVLASLPYRVARLTCYTAAILVLGASLWAWTGLAFRRLQIDPRLRLASIVLTLGLLYPYVIRDLDDCGLQILLLGMMTAAVVALEKGWQVTAGFWLAAAASYKLTPFLTLPYVIWKRQWRAAASMIVGIFILNLALPSALLGWDVASESNRRWLERVLICARTEDPSANGVEPARHQNQCLPMAIARFVQTYPEGHDLYMSHPLFVQFGSLEPKQAKWVVQGALLALAGALAWHFRRRWEDPTSTHNPVKEWSAVCILCALMSQLCWLQHLVLALPAVLLLMGRELAHRATGGSWKNHRTFALAAIGVIVLLLQRDVVQRDLSVLILSYKLDTFAVLLAMVTALSLDRSAVSGVVSPPEIVRFESPAKRRQVA